MIFRYGTSFFLFPFFWFPSRYSCLFIKLYMFLWFSFNFHKKLFHHRNFTKIFNKWFLYMIICTHFYFFLFSKAFFSKRYFCLFIKLCYCYKWGSFLLRFSFNFIKTLPITTISQKK